MPTVSPEQLESITKQVKRVNRRAEKLGVEGITLTVSDPYVRTHTLPDNTERQYTVQDVTVTGPTVKVNGWTFAVTIDHPERLIRSHNTNIPFDTIEQYVDTPTCDQCSTNRDRRITYLLSNGEGDVRQVGSSCIADFVGHNVNLSVMDTAADIATEVQNLQWWDATPLWDLTDFLATTFATVREHGWVPRSMRYGNHTSTRVSTRFRHENATPEEIETLEDRVRWTEPTDDDYTAADEAHEWALELDPKNDYLFNIRSVAENGYVTARTAGLAASIVRAWERDRKQAAAPKPEPVDRNPVPVTNERISIEGVVVNVTYKRYQMGDPRHVFTVRDDRGFTVWGTCPSSVSDVERGDRVKFDANVDPSPDDPTFGFTRRPSKAVKLTPEPVLPTETRVLLNA